MITIYEYYDQNPQKEGHVDIIFIPRFAKRYVHFDNYFFYKNEPARFDRGGSGWGGNDFHSLDRLAAVRYILSEDKKIFRKSLYTTENFCDGRVSRLDYHQSIENFWYWTGGECKQVILTCHESEVNLSAERPSLYVNRVAVWCPPYLCPTTGILWDYCDKTMREGLLSERFWLFKQLPKTRVVMSKAGRCEVKRDVNIMTLDDPGVFDTEIFQSRSKTAFLSGEKMIQKRLELNPWQLRETPVHDARRFLGKQPKISKFTMIRSAARYLRRRLKISPLRPAEKTFFQMMGAMAHINNETLNRKKAYAA